MLKKWLLLILGVVLFTSPALAVQVNEMAPDFSLTDIQGKTHSLSDYKGKYVVLEWVNYECPFVKKHYQSGNMQSLQKEYADKGVVWLSVNSSAKGKQGYFTPDKVAQIIENSDAAPTAYLFDTDGKVGKMYQAKTTPHMFIVNPEGSLIYQGAIDSVPSFDSSDIAQADNYVKMTLNQAMSGNPLTMPQTKAYGCSVKY